MTTSPRNTDLSRRGFLAGAAAAAFALGLEFGSPLRAFALTEKSPRLPEDFRPNAFLTIGTDGRVTVISKHDEMGQGIHTGLAMAICEELEIDVDQVQVVPARASADYAHSVYGLQITGGSSSTWSSFEQMRRAGAVARVMLVAAAAELWQADPAACSARNGRVTLAGSDRSLRYGELAAAAANQVVPEDVSLKPASEFTRIGRPTRRLDSPAKVRGQALFSLDKSLPGMLTAIVLRAPEFGGKLEGHNGDALLELPGVVWVGEVPSGLAIVTEGYWAAHRARDAAEPRWASGPSGASLDSELLRKRYEELAAKPGLVARDDGDVDAALAEAEKKIDVVYEVPFQAHAPMEPLSCLVELRDDGGARIITGSQMLGADHPAAAKRLGVELEKVEIENSYLGGGFGRRANPASDFVLEAIEVALAARELGRPIKTVWSREDDLRGGWYRPMFVNRVSVGMAGDQITAWRHRIVGQSIAAGTPFEASAVEDGVDHLSVEGASDAPLGVPNLRVELHTVALPVPVQWWRSVGHSNTAFPKEAMIDECATALGRDPYDLRRELLAGHARLLRVLDLAAEKAEWKSRKLPKGVGRGIAVHESFKGFAAHVVEASVENGQPRIHRVVCAIDCGPVVNPSQVKAQMEGAAIFALSSVIGSGIHFRDGRVVESNFHDFRIMRMHESPKVEVHIVDSQDEMGGIGEVGVPGLAPATCAALFEACGKRIRRLPINDQLA